MAVRKATRITMNLCGNYQDPDCCVGPLIVSKPRIWLQRYGGFA